MKVGIIGLGLIGGSMAIDLRRKGFASRILGVESDPVNAAAAEKIGLADKVVDFGECVRESDIVILAVPVGAAVKLLPEVLDIFAEDVSSGPESSDGSGKCRKTVIDVCKKAITNMRISTQKSK